MANCVLPGPSDRRTITLGPALGIAVYMYSNCHRWHPSHLPHEVTSSLQERVGFPQPGADSRLLCVVLRATARPPLNDRPCAASDALHRSRGLGWPRATTRRAGRPAHTVLQNAMSFPHKGNVVDLNLNIVAEDGRAHALQIPENLKALLEDLSGMWHDDAVSGCRREAES